MNFFKRKTTEELVAETKRDRLLLDSISAKNKIVKAHSGTKRALKDAKKEAFESTAAGMIWKGFKKEVRKRSDSNKKKFDVKGKKDEGFTPGLLKD